MDDYPIRLFDRIKPHKVFLIFFSVAGLEMLAASVLMFSIPGDPKNALLLGMSGERILMLSLMLVSGLAMLGASRWLVRDVVRSENMADWLSGKNPSASFVASLSALGIAFVWFLVFSPVYRFGAYAGYYERLFPLILWLGIICFQTLVLVTFARAGIPNFFTQIHRNTTFHSSLIILGIILLTFFLIVSTKIGITPDDFHWNDVGVPLLGWSIWCSTAIGLLAYWISRSRKTFTHKRWVDLLVFLGIWIIAQILWGNAPMTRSFFAPGPYPPEMAFFPFSDSVTYDLSSQYALIGEGFSKGRIVDKPLYSFILLAIHWIAGNDFNRVLFIQAAFFAVLPALVYLLGKGIHSREAGLTAAGLVVSREITAYQSTTALSTSHSKLILSEIPTAICLVLFTVFMINWLKNKDYDPHWIAAAGGMLGLSTLVRHNPWLLLPFSILLIIVIYGRRIRLSFSRGLVFCLVFIAAIAPWGLRDYQQTGTPLKVINTLYNVVIRGRYGPLQSTPLPPLKIRPSMILSENMYTELNLPREVDPSSLNPQSNPILEITVPRGGNQQRIFTSLGFIPAHFAHNLVTTALILPTSWQYHDLANIIYGDNTPQSASWDGKLAAGGVILLIINLAVVSIGIGSSFRRYRAAGLLPLGVYLMYTLAAALARTSGGRYIVPIEWVLYLYYGTGLITIFSAIWSFLLPGFQAAYTSSDHVTGNSPNWKKTPSLVAGLFLIVGSVIPLSDVYIPQQYPPKNAINLVQQMESEGILQQIEIDEDYLRDFINAPGARLLWGKGLYPRFYNISRGEPDQYSFLQTKPYPRFTLTIISQNGGQVILPMTKPPTDFPNGSQVYAIGCSNHQALNALALVLVKQDGLATLISRQPEVPWSCPVPEPVCDDNRNCN